MKKNCLIKTPAKKTTKKCAKKNAKQLHEDKITKILSMVSDICDYAIENLCTETSQFEELELKLREYIK